jgi:soluble lytic murein transglycosylase-like protein
MASPELLTQLNSLKQQLAELQKLPIAPAQEPTPQSPIDVSTTGKAQLASGAGGLLGIADMLTFGGAGQVVAGGNALIDALQGKPIGEAYTERAAQTAALKDFYRQRAAEQNLTVLGMPITEAAAGVKGPVVGLLGKGGGVVSSALKGGALGAGMGAAYPLVAVDVPEEQRAQQATMGAGLGAFLGAGAGAASGLIEPAAEAGMALRRSARGMRKTDSTKTFNNALIEEIPGAPETKVKAAMDDLIANKTLGKSIDPTEMYNNLQVKKVDLEGQIQSTLQQVDEVAQNTGKKVITVKDLQFPETMKFLESGRFDPRQTDAYINQIDSLKDAILREGGGKLVTLNEIKRGIGEGWSDLRKSDPTFWRAMYKDLKTTIEKYAPEVRDLNAQKQKLLIAEPIIGRGVRAEESMNLNAARTMFNTTGGSSLVGALQFGTNIGAPAATIATNIGLKAAASNQGKEAIGRLLQNLNVPAKTIKSVVGPTIASTRMQTQKELTEKEKNKVKIAKPKAKPLPIQIGKKKIADVSIPKGAEYADEALVKAMIEVESGGKVDAVSAKGAIGLMQIMPKTAKELGIDPKDPQQNVEGGSRYAKQMEKKFGDRKLAVAAYNMGPGALEKAINRAGTTSWPSIVKRLGIYSESNKKGVPQETVDYVNKILAKLGR